MTKLEECPFCGSQDLTAKSEPASVTVPYGPVIHYSSAFYVCGKCQEEAAADEEERDAARQEAIVVSIRTMLDDLKAQGISAAHFERALRLPQRTTARWKMGNVSASSVALLRLVRTFQWLLNVADDDFQISPTTAPAVGSTIALLGGDLPVTTTGSLHATILRARDS